MGTADIRHRFGRRQRLTLGFGAWNSRRCCKGDPPHPLRTAAETGRSGCHAAPSRCCLRSLWEDFQYVEEIGPEVIEQEQNDRQDENRDQDYQGGADQLPPGRPRNLVDLRFDGDHEIGETGEINQSVRDPRTQQRSRKGKPTLNIAGRGWSISCSRQTPLQPLSPAPRTSPAGQCGPGSACRRQIETALEKRRSPASLSASIGSIANGRGGVTRTLNRRFWRPVLYQLSYTPGSRIAHRQRGMGDRNETIPSFPRRRSQDPRGTINPATTQ